MDHLSLVQLLEVARWFGLPGMILVIWWLSARDQNRLIQTYRDDLTKTLNKYQADMTEIRQMYSNNVELVKASLSLARDLRETVVLNTQKWQQAHDAIATQQFCPAARDLRRGEK